jgi:glycylpeptide N-tetradecanoyltransferase
MPHGRRGDHPEGPIEPNKPPSEIRQDPYTMPSGFEWSLVDVSDPEQRSELYNLLAQNYVEDDDALFRFDYSPEFLIWALTPPGYDPNFVFGVRSSTSSSSSSPPGRLVAFISGVPATVQVNSNVLRVVEINFLCVHKKLRSKRLAPVLIKEMTRRVNLTGVFQAVYTAGTVLPVPVATARYHHRSLNPKKLVNVGFSRLSGKMTLARLLKLYKLPGETTTPGLREMRESDVPHVHKLLEAYMSKFAMKILFTEDDVAHWLLPRDRVVHAYVAEQPPRGGSDSTGSIITDLISFYHLPSSILQKKDTLYSVYSYYNVATSVPLVDLMKDALILAKRSNYDVFNALDLMENDEFLEPLKFGLGDGFLQYYIYNWACPELRPSQVGVVLL